MALRTEADTLEAAPSLMDIHARMRQGALNLASADGQWAFGLAMFRESTAL